MNPLDHLPHPSDLDEAARPTAPPIPGATDEHRAHGRHLALIHRMHLRDLSRVRALVDQAGTDALAAEALADAIEALPMAANLRHVGAVCGYECRALFFHHGAEEHQIFPILEMAGSEGLRAVVAKLRAEHEVIHALIEALGARAARLVETPDQDSFDDLREVFDRLETAVRSHFGYEETELEEALGFHRAL